MTIAPASRSRSRFRGDATTNDHPAIAETMTGGIDPFLTSMLFAASVRVLITSDEPSESLQEQSTALPARGLVRAPSEWALLVMLAAVQFTVAVDFIIMMPLGPQFMKVFAIATPAFNFAVSAYAFAAGISGLCASLFLDRMDRKTALLLIYAGFTVGTLFCAIAPSYETLVLARALAGFFGGIVGGISLAIVGDLVPEQRRAAALGTVMSAFSVAQVAGVPLGLYLAHVFSWHVPFLALAIFSALIWGVSFTILPKVRDHLGLSKHATLFSSLFAVFTNGQYLRALVLMAVITLGGFMIFTDMANFLVSNVGLNDGELRLVYLVGGCATLISMNSVGRLADKFGRARVFRLMMLCSIISAFVVTHLSPVPAWVAIVVTTFLMVTMTSRFIPAMALITGAVAPRHRGSFMSINSSVAQFSSALAATLAAMVIHDQPDHHLAGYGNVGLIYVAWAVAGLWIAAGMRPSHEQVAPEAVAA